jgi:hypothetical protein
MKMELFRAPFAAIFLIATLFTASGASATAVIDRATGLGSPSVLIDFGNGLFPNGTGFTNQFAASGVTFGSNYEYRTSGNQLPSLKDGFLFPIAITAQPGSIFFSSNVSDALFSWRTNDSSPATFQAYLDGNLVESIFSGSTDGTVPLVSGKFYGFEDILFNEIRLAVSTPNGYTLDNLQFNVVPEHTTLTLFGLALLGLGAARRRKKRAA